MNDTTDTLGNKVKIIKSLLVETLRSFQQDSPAYQKLINIICIAYGGMSIYHLYKEFPMLKFMFHNISGWNYSIILYFINILILPFANYLFWKSIKAGWVLMALFLSYSAVIAAHFFIESLLWAHYDPLIFEEFLQFGSPEAYLLSLIFFGGTLLIMCKKKIREVYKIEQPTMFTTIGLTMAFVGMIAFAF